MILLNGAISWNFNWYSDGHVSIGSKSKSSFSGKLIGVNDYEKGKLGKNKMVSNIKGIGADYYVMFNLATGINSGVIEGRNMVLITSHDNSSYPAPSLREAMLNSGDLYAIPGTNYFVEVVKIKLNAKTPYAKVVVKSKKKKKKKKKSKKKKATSPAS